MASSSYTRLVERADVIRDYGTNLAVSLGNFFGFNDYAMQKVELENGFILRDLQNDLIALVVLRTYGLMADRRSTTDATLPGIALDLNNSPALQAEVVEEAHRWPLDAGLEDLADHNAHWAASKMSKFLSRIGTIDVSMLKNHRHWVLAHSTTKKADPVMMKDVWQNARATLDAVDLLSAFALGKDADLVGGCDARREQCFQFCTLNLRPSTNGE